MFLVKQTTKNINKINIKYYIAIGVDMLSVQSKYI